MSDAVEDFVTRFKSFMKQPWLEQRLQEDEEHPNFWTIIEYGRRSYEIRYSKMLRWLLDPSGNHGLGNYVAHEMALLAAERAGDPQKLEELKAALKNRSGSSGGHRVETEALKRTSGGIDVLYHEDATGLLIAIENKMYSDEHIGKDGDSQLNSYARAVDRDPKCADFPHKYFIFLTGDGHPPQDQPTEAQDEQSSWVPFSYEEDLTAILKAAYERLGANPHRRPADEVRSQNARKLIADFIIDIQKKFSRLDEEAQEALESFKQDRDLIASLLEAMGHRPSLEDDEADQVDEETEKLRQRFELAFRYELRKAEKALDILGERINTQGQDHRPSADSQRIIRLMFNRLVDPADQLDMAPGPHLGKERAEERIAEITNQRFRALGLRTTRVTQGKGQGLRLMTTALDAEDGALETYTTYISGDKDGLIPNDYFQVHIHPTGRVDWGTPPGWSRSSRRVRA